MDILTESDMSGLFESVTKIDKAHPYKIDSSFEKRSRVWRNQLLPDYLMQVRKEPSIEYIERMEERMNKDYMSICVKGLFSRNVSKLDILELKDVMNGE